MPPKPRVVRVEPPPRRIPEVEAAIGRHAKEPGGLLPLLHEVQDRLGYVPENAVTRIAAAMNQSRAEVHGVITFYHHFRTTPPGRHVLQVCCAEACQSMGSARLLEHAQSRLGIRAGETTSDGAITLERVYCLGNCACSPSVMIDGTPAGRVTPERFDALVDALETAP